MNHNARLAACGVATLLGSGTLHAQSSAEPSQASTPWTELNPAELYPGFTYQGLSPSCAASPPTADPNTGAVTTYASEFKFYFKRGSSRKLLVYFEGGGACWDSMNCLYAHTYSEEATSLAELTGQTDGILDFENPDNPFRNWSIIYIPYCTGDLHWGAADVKYADIADAYDGEPQTIQHRGHVNFQVVLQWMRDNFYFPKQVFVAGSSAGGYGALVNFAFVRETFEWAKVDVLVDAANGIASADFFEAIPAWNIQFPTWVPGLQDGYVPGVTMGEVIQAVTDKYRWSNVAQFTTAWDDVQTNVLHISYNIGAPETWQSDWPSAWCDWNARMNDMVSSSAGLPNYRYYIAPGMYHTLLTTSDFYDERTRGVPFSGWVRRLVGSYPAYGLFKWWLPNVECRDCADPVVCE